MAADLLKAFIIGSSLPAAAVTWTYTGLAFHRTDHNSIVHYETLPFITAGILGAANILGIYLQKNNILPSLTAQAVAGATAGSLLSLVGHEGFDLPTRIFEIPQEKQYLVHIGAPVLYMGIFTTIINWLNHQVLD